MPDDQQRQELERLLERMEALGERAQRVHDALRPLLHRVAELRRRVAEATSSSSDREALEQAEADARRAAKELEGIENEMIEVSGLPRK